VSKLNSLIKGLCPEEVEYKTLGELGFFYGGLSGKNKNDFVDGNSKFISYMNVFSNPEIDLTTNDKVLIKENEKQNTLEFGDIIFTGSSESLFESGMSSVLTERTDDKLYLNSFCFGFRLNNRNLLLPAFSKHLFRSLDIRKQIIRLANGVTRFNLSRKKMEKVQIPIPPLPIQEEIVRILDTFTKLTTELKEELTAELTARKKQYEYYRDELLTFGDEVEWKTLAEIGELIRGTGLQKSDFKEEGFPCIHYGQLHTYYGTSASETISFVSPEQSKKLKKAQKGDVLIVGVSENIEDICKPLAWLGETICISGDMFAFRHNQNTKYITYLLQTSDFSRYKERYAHGAKVTRLRQDKLLSYKIPIPPLAEQERIVCILDKFDALVNDISIGLPAEIEARQKQYEYYREKLLSFKELKVKEA